MGRWAPPGKAPATGPEKGPEKGVTMMLIHERMARGRTRTGWLEAFHSFSFGGFRDPTRMGVGPLRVLNDDRIAPGAGFPAHGHADMDILTYVTSGRLRHEDSLGNAGEIGAGAFQMMNVGDGITHAERNASGSEALTLYQIWLIPDRRGGPSTYHQRQLPETAGSGGLHLVAAPGGADGALPLRSDSRLWLARPDEGAITDLPLAPGRRGFVHLTRGMADVGGETLRAGDALEVSGAAMPSLRWLTEGEALYFDLP